MYWKEYSLEGWDGNSIKKTISYPSEQILLLDIEYLSDPPKAGIKNLLSIDKNGIIKWVADIPKEEEEMYAAYSWIEPIDEKRLKAWCGSSYCEIDTKTGKILLEKFVK